MAYSKKEPYKFAAVRTDTVGLVEHPANMRAFAFSRSSEDPFMPFSDEIISKLTQILNNPDVEIERAAALCSAQVGSEAQAALISAGKLLSAYRDQLPPSALVGLAEAAGYELKLPKQAPASVLRADGTINLDAVPEEHRAALAAVDSVARAARDAAEKATKELEIERQKSKRIEVVARARASWKNVGPNEVLADILLGVERASPDLAKNLGEVFDALDKKLSTGELFRTAGTVDRHETEDDTTPSGRMKKLSAEFQRANPTATPAQTWEAVFRADPALFREYRGGAGTAIVRSPSEQ